MRCLLDCFKAGRCVSIHAPARGAMSCMSGNNNAVGFNSRTREGCDTVKQKQKRYKMFQFTHPRGVRLEKTKAEIAALVSIHAPARGAILLTSKSHSESGFNSRTREGCDHKNNLKSLLFLFQFTHPRGVRCPPAPIYPHWFVSIHAPARGAISGPAGC